VINPRENPPGADWITRSKGLRLPIGHFINGRKRSTTEHDLVTKFGPRDGRTLYNFGLARAEEVNEAVSSARGAFADGRWSKTSVQFRKDCLYRLASLIEAHQEELALLECLDVGKPIRDALGFDVPQAAAELRYYAEAADKCNGAVYATDHTSLSYQLRRPMGVAAGLVGWNFPLLLAIAKVGPALATGNTLVLKPSELTPLSAVRLAELAAEAGIPPGVLNVILGAADTGAALAHHNDIDILSFTGSSATGKRLLAASGQSNMKRLILECGGKSPNIVFDDAPDLERVAEAIVSGAFRNQGQVCTASSRLLIHEGVKKELIRSIVRITSQLTPGDPLDPNTTFGAVVSREHAQKILSYLKAGESEGATAIYRPKFSEPVKGGFYIPPVIFGAVRSNHRIAQEEIFGPVLSVMSFRTEEEAVHLANDTIYGLSAVVWTKDMGRAHRLTQDIKAGWIVVNATADVRGGPGAGALSVGGHRQSGIGVEGGIAGLEAYTSDTAVQFFV
jgi:acyl-CoA reductase-like NAD-dependent aldehyde dehydrogenase